MQGGRGSLAYLLGFLLVVAPYLNVCFTAFAGGQFPHDWHSGRGFKASKLLLEVLDSLLSSGSCRGDRPVVIAD